MIETILMRANLTVQKLLMKNNKMRVRSRGVMIKALVTRSVGSEFEFKSHNYVHFQINTFELWRCPWCSRYRRRK